MKNRGLYLPEADVARQIYIKEDPELAEVGHFHEGIELVAVVQGEIEACRFAQKEVLRKGEIFFADSFDCHHYRALTPDVRAIVIVLSSAYTELFRELYDGKTFPAYMQDCKKNEEIISFMRVWLEDREKDFLRSIGYCNVLLSKIAEQYPLIDREEKKDKDVIIKLLQYVNEHYAEDVSLTKAAASLGYSKEYCSKIFYGAVGIGFRDYLNFLRMRQVNEYISNRKQHKMTTMEIAYKCGFNSMATFYRAQKAYEDKILNYDID